MVIIMIRTPNSKMKLGEKHEFCQEIGLFACTGVVTGDVMGSGIALLPANLASIGGIAIWGWVISIIGAMSLAYVYARLATKNPQQGGPIAYAGEISPAFGFRPAFFIIMLTGLVTWQLVLPLYLVFPPSSQF
ncbi:amino acid permease [Shigella flexneri]